MKIYKALYRIALFSGILILMVGLYLELTHQSTTGNTAQYDGTPLSQTLDGLSTIYLGVLILLIALIARLMYKQEKKKFNDLD